MNLSLSASIAALGAVSSAAVVIVSSLDEPRGA
jgi:hypothetical protein